MRAGEISGRHLGCDVQAFDADGATCPPGVEGELVVTAPMPTMPVAFWGDDDGAKLRAAYFDDYPGVWRHGDWVTFFADGACVVSGRSDATLNRGGVRLGTSDFYAVVDALPEIADSLVVYLEERGDDVKGELLLFVALAPGTELDDSLVARIATALRNELLAASCARRRARGPVDPAHVVGQEARSAGEAHPHRHSRRGGREPRARSPTPTRSPGSSASRHRDADAGQVPWHLPVASVFVVPSAHTMFGFSWENTPLGLSHPGTTHACTIQPVLAA